MHAAYVTYVFFIALLFYTAGKGAAQTYHPEVFREALSDSKQWFRLVKVLDEDSLAKLWNEGWFPEHPSGVQRKAQVMRWLAKANPEKAHTLLISANSSKEDWEDFIRGWAGNNLDEAFAFVLQWPSGEIAQPTQARLASIVLDVSIKAGDANWVNNNINKLDPAVQYESLAGCTWAWASLNGEQACRWLMPFEGGKRWSVYIMSGFAQWGRQDPDSAWEALETLNGEGYESALSGFTRGLMIRDLSEGLQFLRNLQDSGRVLRALDTIGLECGGCYPEKGLMVWDALETEEQADVFAKAFLDRFAQDRPEEAALLLKNVYSEDVRRNLVDDIASAWYRKSPDAAIQWVNAMEDRELQKEAHKGIVLEQNR